MGVLVAIIGDVSLFPHQLLKLATRLVPYQPSEDFAGKDLKVVVVLVCARGTKPT